MGKIDDMRRQREERHAQGERDAKVRAAAAGAGAAPPLTVEAPAAITNAPTVRVTAPAFGTRRPAAADTTGACAGCGKQRPVHGGVVASHQKGLGKICPGSRQPPA